MKLKLKNNTQYFTKDLKKLFMLCLKSYKRTNFNFKHEVMNVTCNYRRIKDGFCGGYAYYNAPHVTMLLPKEDKPYAYIYSMEQGRSCNKYFHSVDNLDITLEEFLAQNPHAVHQQVTLEQRIAQTFLHELDHTKGMKHAGMMPDFKRDISFLPSDFKLRTKAQKEKVVLSSADKDVKKHTQLQALYAKWAKRKKNAERKIATLSKKMKYYEKKLAANSFKKSC